MISARRGLLLVTLTLAPMAAPRADLVVVANAKSGIERLTRNEVVNIFLGRFRQLPTGDMARPADQPDDAPEKARFYRLLVNKELTDINAYWTRLVFSGKTSPPYQAKSRDDIADWLNRYAGALAYMERGQVGSGSRIVLELER
jgi:hypothetical protein